ncbi:hypothetical protein TNCV_1117611 [Trichonephila clavipes]|nr:hypothetical protein TNCV_1117611 [Trichonephila clavipes]
MAPQLARDLDAMSGRRVSRPTVYSRLAQFGLYAWRSIWNDILEAYVRVFWVLWARTTFLWTIMRSHTELTSLMDFMKEDSSSMSPGQNSIEYVWDGLGKAISQLSCPTSILRE